MFHVQQLVINVSTPQQINISSHQQINIQSTTQRINNSSLFTNKVNKVENLLYSFSIKVENKECIRWRKEQQSDYKWREREEVKIITGLRPKVKRFKKPPLAQDISSR